MLTQIWAKNNNTKTNSLYNWSSFETRPLSTVVLGNGVILFKSVFYMQLFDTFR